MLFVLSQNAFANIVCEQSNRSFTVKGETRGNSKVVFICTGKSGIVNFTTNNLNFVLGKRLYSIRAFPTGTSPTTGNVKLLNSRSWDLLQTKGDGLIDPTGQKETSAYNDLMGTYWYPPFDDENGYSIQVESQTNEANFTVEISIVEEIR